ncbi:MAG: response regulator [Deltaproteobacteria bacterium]|nr:response regulator [Deltaproteobacteria bacterium]
MSRCLLLVEDDADYRSLLSDFLRSLGHAVLEFASAEEALGHMDGADAEAPSLVLTDLRMARMSGLDLARTLRRAHPRLPIILMTAFSERPLAGEALALGRSGFVEKPFRLAVLREEIERLLAAGDE